MPDYRLIHQYARAAVPEFTDLVIQAFAFLETAYGYRLHERSVDIGKDTRDAEARVTYISEKVALSHVWALESVAMGVSFIQLDQPYTMPTRAVYQAVHTGGNARTR